TPYLFRPENKAADREYIFRKASARTGLPAYIIEKDYMVCIALSLIFDDIKPQCTEKTDTPFLFKGGTSLSKVYNVINRMSEDIDLSLSMDYLGCPEPEDESNSARKRRIKKLTEHGCECVSTIIKTCFEKQLSSFHKGFEVLVDPDESQNLIVNYPRSLNDSDYHNSCIKPHILIETGGRAAFDPHSSHQISPIALDEISTLLQIDEDCCCIVDVLEQS
ncbi:MAG: nucleotidyl transferase AbiEii/AbiGii toxin family protein, partial [Spirochaetales bacterium]|nr:nucleotidyl transferase AbiEii/AbiGii toxin family protein [Spirochaetales bacterium]